LSDAAVKNSGENQSRLRAASLALAILFILLCTVSATDLERFSVRSQSGQFTVHGLPLGVPVARYTTSNVPYLRLDPTLTAVSLERIRQTLSGELKLSDRWKSPITVTTHPMTEDNPTVRMTSARFNDGWGYKIELPERLDKERFIRVAVRAILLEVANRTAVDREAELPPWLAEGLASELEANSLPTLALEPQTQVARRDYTPDVMRTARAILRHRPALTFDELSMPSQEQVSGENAALYRACAHVLVHNLLRLRHGRECLREMLVRLPENLNWQTTFLKAFAAHFPRLIDADKWYAVNIATLGGREQMSVWPLETTAEQLDEILSTPVQVRLETGDLPIQTDVTLQRIIAEWKFPQQLPVLRQKLHRLEALRQRAAPELSGLVGDYVQTIQSYALGKQSGRRASGKARAVIEELDALDLRRQSFRDRPAKTAANP
jgi:hypothetical protein